MLGRHGHTGCDGGGAEGDGVGALELREEGPAEQEHRRGVPRGVDHSETALGDEERGDERR